MLIFDNYCRFGFLGGIQPLCFGATWPSRGYSSPKKAFWKWKI